MRLWTLHPQYHDTRGLVALWREALLAQAVLKGQTRGYTHHPQLVRFLESASPVEYIASYLKSVFDEAVLRGYHFDGTKIGPFGSLEKIVVTSGQLDHEWEHLKQKLRLRDPSRLAEFGSLGCPQEHSLFNIVPGPVAGWEIIRSPDPRVEKV